MVFQVHDSGPGIPERFEQSIWERFERGAHRHEPASGGLGIGLPIARALVEAHGGTIHQRRSEVLGGACFEFTLPAATADDLQRWPGRPAGESAGLLSLSPTRSPEAPRAGPSQVLTRR